MSDQAEQFLLEAIGNEDRPFAVVNDDAVRRQPATWVGREDETATSIDVEADAGQQQAIGIRHRRRDCRTDLGDPDRQRLADRLAGGLFVKQIWPHRRKARWRCRRVGEGTHGTE
jgi:hypothetical protein